MDRFDIVIEKLENGNVRISSPNPDLPLFFISGPQEDVEKNIVEFYRSANAFLSSSRNQR